MTPRILITGGAGFIGTNAAAHFARKGWEVTVLDSLGRPGAAANLEWLRRRVNLAFERADVRDRHAVDHVFALHGPFEAILHLAAQVAVTTSIDDPRADFEINALGTLNVLEACRRRSPAAAVLNASTNKVYGDLADVDVERTGERYRYVELAGGIPESRMLSFHSPYGCSKGAAEQYALDYHRTYGLRTVSFRQSCIYGPRQFGIEDQGWLAWFVIAAVLGRPITIYGDGCQLRDVLHVQDLVAAYDAAIAAIDEVAGTAYNAGGGPGNTLSLLELLALLRAELDRSPSVAFAAARPGDQLVYVSDISRLLQVLDWRPRIPLEQGLPDLIAWVSAHRDEIGEALGLRAATPALQ